jgi:hypothetical protein
MPKVPKVEKQREGLKAQGARLRIVIKSKKVTYEIGDFLP